MKDYGIEIDLNEPIQIFYGEEYHYVLDNLEYLTEDKGATEDLVI